eukprot:Nitzschia sp. Nitz4//scaffold256_size27904//17710//18274//NITZ4_008170-RA/size27904-exonerate_est2genome-gene-0.0-mRNA-1//1//CDS//3329544414//2674//frame0
MASFQHPESIIHTSIEPQWFTRRKDETSSILTAVEEAEEVHAQNLYKVITELAPASSHIIGKMPESGGSRRHRVRTSAARGVSGSTPRRSTSTPSSESGNPSSTAAAPGSRDAVMAMASPPPVSSSQRFWNRSTRSGRRSSSGARTIAYD